MKETLPVALIAAALAAVGAWTYQDARIGVKVTEAQLEAAEYREKMELERRANDRRAYQTAEAMHLNYTKALNENSELLAKAVASAAAAQRNANRLRQQLRAADVRIQTASAEAVREYAATANQLLRECSARYTSLAAKADGHAADARVCRAAWPVIPLHDS